MRSMHAYIPGLGESRLRHHQTSRPFQQWGGTNAGKCFCRWSLGAAQSVGIDSNSQP